MPVYLRDPLTDAGWTALLQSHRLASIFHTQSWLAALQCTYGYQPLLASTCPPGVELTNGIVFCEVKGFFGARRMVSLPFSDHCEPLAGSESELELLLTSVAQLLKTRNCRQLEFRPLHAVPPAGAGFGPSNAYLMHAIDLTADPAHIFQRFHKDSIQRKIQRAGREQLAYEEGRSEKLLRDFYQLLLKTRRRHRLAPQPMAWFRNLATLIGDALKVRVAYKNSEPVASIITVHFKNSMVYKYGCSDSNHHRLGGMHLLLWRAIQEALQRQSMLFDLGRCDIENHGLATFKERWGASRAPLAYWTSPPASKPAKKKWYHSLSGHVFARLPDPLLAAAGRVLYRHFG
ncbi:MAG: GNAT family N-acetyltransferase [Acidobacteriales bacterium]|nr:GNAT family N-acetyltransferase [Terriglobales bacterium]